MSVTGRPSMMTSLVRKSAPIVALYEGENFSLTYSRQQHSAFAAACSFSRAQRRHTNWFMSDVLPTPLSPRIIT